MAFFEVLYSLQIPWEGRRRGGVQELGDGPDPLSPDPLASPGGVLKLSAAAAVVIEPLYSASSNCPFQVPAVGIYKC